MHTFPKGNKSRIRPHLRVQHGGTVYDTVSSFGPRCDRIVARLHVDFATQSSWMPMKWRSKWKARWDQLPWSVRADRLTMTIADLPGGDWVWLSWLKQRRWSDRLVDRLASNQLGMLLAKSSQVMSHYALVLLSSNSYGSLMFDLLLDRHNWNLLNIDGHDTWNHVNGSVVHSEKYTASLMVGHDALKYSCGSSHDTRTLQLVAPAPFLINDGWLSLYMFVLIYGISLTLTRFVIANHRLCQRLKLPWWGRFFEHCQ